MVRAVWVPWNLGWLGLPLFDPYPFGLLTMIVSLEAIFLSIFVLLAQKRESAIAELREELALQVNLRIEEESTKTLQLVAGLYTRLGHRVAADTELHDMMQPLDVAGLQQALASEIAHKPIPRRVEPEVDQRERGVTRLLSDDDQGRDAIRSERRSGNPLRLSRVRVLCYYRPPTS